MFDKTTLSWDTLKTYVVTEPAKIYTSLSPSSLGGCMRSHYWKVLGIPSTTPPNPGALVNFKVGHHWEKVLADAYESQGMLVKHFQDGVDKFYDPETHLGGTPDLLVKYNDELIIVDSKTVASAWFNYAKTKPMSVWVKENSDYVYQQVAYVYLARKAGYKVDKAILSFASKDNGYIGLEFQITVTDELIQKVVSRAKTLKGYLDRKELPPCTCEGWKVGYCNYGNPATQKENTKKKLVNSECCDPRYVIKKENNMAEWTEVGESTNSTTWDKKKPLQGVYTRKESNVGPNESNMYTVKTDNGNVGVWGSTVLDSKFEQVPVGAEVLIESLGMATGKSGKEYADYSFKYRAVPMTEVGQDEDLIDFGE